MTRKLMTAFVAFVVAAALGACVPGTYYDPTDRYARGLRLFDRGQHANAISVWKPLAEAGDCDAQYRYGTLFFLGAGVQQSFDLARDWWSKAANQGQYRAQLMLATMYVKVAMMRMPLLPDSGNVMNSGGTGAKGAAFRIASTAYSS